MHRRGFLTGALGFLAAPAIIRVSSLMPVSVIPPPMNPMHFLGLAPFKVEGSTTEIDGYLASNYEWFVFNDLRGAFGAVPDVSNETILRAINKLGDEMEGRFRKTRWRGTPLQLR